MSGPLFVDRCAETTTTTGTGTVTLLGAKTGYQSFAAVGNGNSCYYTIAGGSEWEVGIGTYTSAGTTLSRDTILASSNSGSAVSFSAGTKDVFVDVPAVFAPSSSLISRIVTAGSQATVHLASIPQYFTHLELVWSARDSGAGGAAEAALKVNSDGAAGDYTTVAFGGSGSGTTTVTGTAGPKCMLVPGSNTAAVGAGTVRINDYANTTFNKIINVVHGDSTGIIRVSTTTWLSTAAITDLLVTAPITAFLNGGIFALYGLR